MKNKNVKSYNELLKMNLTDVIKEECWLEFKHNGSFMTANLHEQIMELVKHFSLCKNYSGSRWTCNFDMEDANHFGPSVTPQIFNLHSKNNVKNRFGVIRNVALLSMVEFNLEQCQVETIKIHRSDKDYYVIADNLKTCSIFCYDDGKARKVLEYPIYRLLQRCDKRRLGEIKKEKNEKIRKFEMELVMMGLQGFLDIPSLTLQKTSHSNVVRTAYLQSNGYTITANYKRDWDCNLYDLTHHSNIINMRQLNHKDLKIILTALKDIKKL